MMVALRERVGGPCLAQAPFSLFDPVSHRVMLDADLWIMVLKKSVLVYHGHSKSSTSNVKVLFLPKS